MPPLRKRGRAVEGTSLENWRRGNPFVSSNLTASANECKPLTIKGFFFVQKLWWDTFILVKQFSQYPGNLKN
jgi:hypothetical protein